ncbi:hypothetical protein ACHHYP_04247 [Achlya hypogyna]|uniref:Uncharacterized protein n=1 Tax=Achlya hypogyna TaxID=1202772 RepID=A0A1V9Z1M0_ACHHY|nr:hypothetical protein ACHHYP_04247 [Achlya hypogyna]
MATSEVKAPKRRRRRPLTLEQQELSRQRSRIYYLRHKEKVIAKAKARYDINRDDERARRREVYASKKALKSVKPPETRANQMPTLLNFTSMTDSPPPRRRQRHLTPEQKELTQRRSRVYYLKHKERVLAKSKARYNSNRDDERARRREIYAKKQAAKKGPPPMTGNPLSIRFILN